MFFHYIITLFLLFWIDWTFANQFTVELIFNTFWMIQAHEDRIKDMNDQADSLIESGQFDAAAIQVNSVKAPLPSLVIILTHSQYEQSRNNDKNLLLTIL